MSCTIAHTGKNAKVILGAIIFLLICVNKGFAQIDAKENKKEIMRDTLDGKIDFSRFLIDAHGFIPVPMIITEPALGSFGGLLAPVFITPKKKIEGVTGYQPPDITAGLETVAYFGFALTADALAGRDRDAGWYFCFAQGPQQPRFGLDETPAQQMRSWADLDWSLVNSEGGRLHLGPAPQPPQESDDLVFGADGAQMAAILLQRSIRFAIHGSQLPGLGVD
jgi:hypothetical protein